MLPHTPHISSKDQIVFFTVFICRLQGSTEASERKEDIFTTFTFSVSPTSGRFVLGWAEAGGHTILLQCPGLNTA